MLSFILFALTISALVVGGLWLTWRMIGGDPGRHEGSDDFDWRERPRYDRGPDKLERLVAKFALPVPALAELLETDRLIARADAVLSGAR